MGTVAMRITTEGPQWDVYAQYQGYFASHLHDNALTFGLTRHF